MLDKHLKAQLIALGETSIRRQLYYYVMDWAIIGAAIGTALALDNVFVSVLSIVVVATRQHAMLLLVHDAAHMKLSRNSKVNDWLADMFAGAPCFFSTAAYRIHHADHHRYLNTDKDPDWARKSALKDWQFPKAQKALLILLIRQIFEGGIEWLQLTSKMLGLNKPYSPSIIQKQFLYKFTLFWAVVISVAVAFHRLDALLIYWFIPLLTIFPLLQRFRSITEHFSLERTHELNSARNTAAGAFERFFLAPHSTQYHLVHHLYPAIPHYNLARAETILRQSERYRQQAHQNNGYLPWRDHSTWSDLVRVRVQK